MIKNIITIISVSAICIVALASSLVYLIPTPAEEDNSIFGANLPIAGSTYNLAGSGVSSSASSITLKTLTLPQTGQKLVDSDFSDTFYVTLEPGNKKKQEIAACTTVTQNSGGDATLSGCSRGMSPITPYTASTSLRFTHGGGTQVIFSDPPQLFREYASKENTETISGAWTFSTYPKYTDSTLCSDNEDFCTKRYVDTLVNQGAATSSESTGGISELATQIEMASSTPWSADFPHVIQSKYATSTPAADRQGLFVAVTENDGYLSQLFLDLTESFTWTGSQLFANATITEHLIVGTSVFDATPTSTGLTIIGGFFLDGNATTTGNLFTFNNVETIFNSTSTFNRLLDGTPSTTLAYGYNAVVEQMLGGFTFCRYNDGVELTTNGTGAATANSDDFSITGAANADTATLSSCNFDTTKDWTFTTYVDLAPFADITLNFGVGVTNFDRSGGADGVDHAHFVVYSSSGILEASVSDGATQATSTNLAGFATITNLNKYTIQRHDGEINFFINDIIRATMTSNLPDITTGIPVQFRVEGDGSPGGTGFITANGTRWPFEFVNKF